MGRLGRACFSSRFPSVASAQHFANRPFDKSAHRDAALSRIDLQLLAKLPWDSQPKLDSIYTLHRHAPLTQLSNPATLLSVYHIVDLSDPGVAQSRLTKSTLWHDVRQEKSMFRVAEVFAARLPFVARRHCQVGPISFCQGSAPRCSSRAVSGTDMDAEVGLHVQIVDVGAPKSEET